MGLQTDGYKHVLLYRRKGLALAGRDSICYGVLTSFVRLLKESISVTIS